MKRPMIGTAVRQAEQNCQHALRFAVLATDGDGTLLNGGKLLKRTRTAVESFLAAGGKLVLVTGERTSDIRHFPHVQLCDYVVAENGGVLYQPKTRKTELLGPPIPPRLVRALRQHRIADLKIGKVIACTHAKECGRLEALLKDINLPYQCVANRKDLMVVPRHIDKGTGLTNALQRMRTTSRCVVAVGDAENDVPLITQAGFGVAVANALPALKACAQRVTTGKAGLGVAELIHQLVS